VDVSNSPSFEDVAVLDFFQTSGKNLLAAEEAAGVGHHLAVSIVGADRLPDSGYLRAKLVQEDLVEGSGVPFTILRSTQFFEFLGAIVAGGTEGGEIRLPDALLQCVAADDVAATLAELAAGEPVRGRVELGGPEALPFAEFAGRWLAHRGDDRRAIADPHARYFGTELQTSSLVAGPGARLGHVHLADWLATPAALR
ncbi:MAG TPA: NmrA family transcriptional regulator, partial [Blastococcus sp.]|nr:NmrA family transcriptional regulator [Blastococcus sp.]